MPSHSRKKSASGNRAPSRLPGLAIAGLVVAAVYVASGSELARVLETAGSALRLEPKTLEIFGGFMLMATAAAYTLFTLRSGLGHGDIGRVHKVLKRHGSNERGRIDPRLRWLITVLVLAQAGTWLLIWLEMDDAIAQLNYAAAVLLVAVPVGQILARYVGARVRRVAAVLQPGPLRACARPPKLAEIVREYARPDRKVLPQSSLQNAGVASLGLPLLMALAIGVATLLLTQTLQLGTSAVQVARVAPPRDGAHIDRGTRNVGASLEAHGLPQHDTRHRSAFVRAAAD